MFQSIFIIVLLSFSIITQAALPSDPIQRCLEVRRLVDLSSRQKMATKKTGVLRIKFHKISTSDLLLDNPVGNMDEVIQALQRQIENCNRTEGQLQTVTIGDRTLKREEWCLNGNKKMLQLARAADGNFQKFLSQIKTEFDWYKSEGWPENYGGFNKGAFQFTAYYAPAPILASSKRNGAFLYPIYANPGVVNADSESKKFHLQAPLCGVDPLSKMARGFCLKNANGTYSVAPDREEIHRGAIDPKHIIAYVQDPDDPAFLMLQGSGSLMLDSKKYHINYNGTNGRPRTMLGRIIQCAQDPTCGGNLDAMEGCAKDPNCRDEAKLRCNLSKKIRQSAASEKLIRQYLNHPLNRNKAANLRNRDQSFVFFIKEDGGPYGSENISLTPHVSCATDQRFIPIGMHFIYHSKNTTSWCVAQDRGGAIIGAHVDVYKGEGDIAGIEANGLNHTGSLYVALPKRK